VGEKRNQFNGQQANKNKRDDEMLTKSVKIRTAQ